MGAAVVVWIAIVVATTLFMARRGHSWFPWAVISGALGPLSWPLAVYALSTRLRVEVEPPAEVEVLVAVPPWIDAPEVMVEAVRRLEPLARTATLATVLDLEDRTTPAGRATAEEIDGLLSRIAQALVTEGLVEPPVEHRILYGRAADELARLAKAGGFRAIVFGPDGSRGHHLLQGHVRARLVRLAGLPVLPVRREQVGV